MPSLGSNLRYCISTSLLSCRYIDNRFCICIFWPLATNVLNGTFPGKSWKKDFLSPGKSWNLVFASPGEKHLNVCTNPVEKSSNFFSPTCGNPELVCLTLWNVGVCVLEYNHTLGPTARRVEQRYHNWVQSSLSSEQRTSSDCCSCWWHSVSVHSVQ